MRAMMIRSALTAIGACAALAALAAGGASAATVKIAFETSSHTEQVWVINADGTGRRKLGPGFEPLVAPNGAMVAAARFGPHGKALDVYPASGGSPQAYYNLATENAVPLGWSPDSRYLAVQLEPASSTATSAAGGGVSVIDTQRRMTTLVGKGFANGASFDPAGGGADRLAFSLAQRRTLNAATDVWTSGPDGSSRTRITHDGHSLNPVWGHAGLAFDRERFRGADSAAAYNVWLMHPDGTHVTQITHLAPPPLIDGPVPLAVSASGKRMVAMYVGEDTNEGYTLSVPGHQARAIKVAHHSSVQVGGISRNGRTLLVTLDAFENPTSQGQVATMPFGGGTPKVIARHAGFATWNG